MEMNHDLPYDTAEIMEPRTEGLPFDAASGMVPYPDGLPFAAASIVTNAVRNGLAEKGQHGDLACVVHACWNLVGFGLGVGVPHVHTYGDKSGVVADLPELLKPLTHTVKGEVVADAKALPWAKILPLLFALIQALLTEKEA